MIALFLYRCSRHMLLNERTCLFTFTYVPSILFFFVSVKHKSVVLQNLFQSVSNCFRREFGEMVERRYADMGHEEAVGTSAVEHESVSEPDAGGRRRATVRHRRVHLPGGASRSVGTHQSTARY